MFKKTLVAVALLSAVSMNAAYAVDGTITFTGSIIAGTCEINGASAPANIAVPLGNYSAFEFGASGSTVANATIPMALTNCPASVTNVAILFNGTADTTNPALLAVNAGGATGVGIGIYEADGTTAIPVNNASALVALAAGAGNANFVAKYVSTAATVGEGNANATAQFTIQYR